jgi:hypothetical protein
LCIWGAPAGGRYGIGRMRFLPISIEELPIRHPGLRRDDDRKMPLAKSASGIESISL